ncbi:MAG TPA: 6-phosphogluconolactonase [Candidatus Nanopelagicaceae bacterium]
MTEVYGAASEKASGGSRRPDPEIRSYESSDELVASVVQLVLERIRIGLSLRNVFHLALTGGTTGTLITEQLIAIWNHAPAEFTGLHIWWGDERFVPEVSEERNARLVNQYLRSQGAIHVHEAPSSDMTMDLDAAAIEYWAAVSAIAMDLTLLGVGPDGHVASLFPDQWNASETSDVIAVRDSPKPPPSRLTFSMSKINASESVWLLAAGENKRLAVIEIFARDKVVPASFVHGRHETLLFLDDAANPNH